MSNIISVTEFRTNVSDIVNRVRYQNEIIFLTRGNTVVAKLMGVAPAYPYHQELKAAAASAHNLIEALAIDAWRISLIVAVKVKTGVKVIFEKGKRAAVLSAAFFKRWLEAAMKVEKEISQI